MNAEQWAKVKEIFHSALELSANERGEFIKNTCGTDENLLAEVKSLFEAHDDAEEFIETPALAPMADLVEDSAEFSREGQIIGAYRIESEIGRGGMGAVYLASRADKEFEKKVAVKLIKRGFDTEEIIKRFRYERQILATLEHPFITRLIDGGATDDGLPFLVMDYVEGLPLNQYADENELSINERLRLFLKICSAVQYAHRNLIIHRDLKPSNIFVTNDGTPRLLDFGIAKLAAANANQTLEKTLTRFQAMTPEYASPEQITGEVVTTASDIYSLGVVLYELLTGHRPFTFKTKSQDEISRLITDSQPVKPSEVLQEREKGRKGEREKVELSSNVSPSPLLPFSPSKLRGDLDNIILMAMRKEPERRYSSVEQFADDIQKFLNGLPVIAQEDTFSYRTGKFIKRNKAGVAAGIGIALSLIGGLAATARQARIARNQRDKARREARKAEKINQFLQKMLASADPRTGSKDAKVIEVLSIAAENIESDFANQPEIVADLETTLGLTYLSLGQLESTKKNLKNALDVRLALFPRRSVEAALSLTNYAKLLQAEGKFNEAEPLYLESLETLRLLRGNFSLEVADVLDNLGYALALKGKAEEAVVLHEEELEIRREVLGENPPDLAKTLERLGSVLAMLDKRELAEPLLRRALNIQQNHYEKDHPDIALAMINLAGTIYLTRPAEAEELCLQSLTMRRELLGENHADTVWSLYNLAWVLINRQKNSEAERYLREALAMRGANLPDEHPVVGSCLLLLGRTLLEQKDFLSAKETFEECLDLRLKNLPEGHWLLATTRSFLGESLVYLGESERGKQMMLENYKILKEKLGASHNQTQQAFERMENFFREMI